MQDLHNQQFLSIYEAYSKSNVRLLKLKHCRVKIRFYYSTAIYWLITKLLQFLFWFRSCLLGSPRMQKTFVRVVIRFLFLNVADMCRELYLVYRSTVIREGKNRLWQQSNRSNCFWSGTKFQSGCLLKNFLMMKTLLFTVLSHKASDITNYV